MERQETIEQLAKAITQTEQELIKLHADLDREMSESKSEGETAAQIGKWASIHRVSVHEAIRRHQGRL
jgi:peptide deformylase